MSDQLELFSNEPFSIRLTMADGLKMFQEAYWDRTAKSKTTKKCFKRILKFCEFKNIRFVDEFSQTSMKSLLIYLTVSKLGPACRNTHHMIITRFYNILFLWKEEGRCADVDFTKIPLPKKNPGSTVPKLNEAVYAPKVAWPRKLVYRLVDAAKDLKDDDLSEDIELLYLTGLRPSDFYRITEKNVDFPHATLSGIQHKTITSRLPSGRPYQLAITERMEEVFKARIKRKPLGEPLFGNSAYNHEAWMRQVNRRFKVLREHLQVPHVQLKHMRGSGATLLADNAVDVETIREKYGWSTLRHLPIYARRTMVHQREAQGVMEDRRKEIKM